jgi:hypothetical protein
MPRSPFSVNAGSFGLLCGQQPAAAEIGVTGATPNGAVMVYILDPDKRAVAEVATGADAAGVIERINPIFFNTKNCSSPLDFEYLVLAIDQETEKQATTTLPLINHKP